MVSGAAVEGTVVPSLASAFTATSDDIGAEAEPTAAVCPGGNKGNPSNDLGLGGRSLGAIPAFIAILEPKK